MNRSVISIPFEVIVFEGQEGNWERSENAAALKGTDYRKIVVLQREDDSLIFASGPVIGPDIYRRSYNYEFLLAEVKKVAGIVSVEGGCFCKWREGFGLGRDRKEVLLFLSRWENYEFPRILKLPQAIKALSLALGITVQIYHSEVHIWDFIKAYG